MTSTGNQEKIPNGKGKRVAVVASRYNRDVCEGLLKGALEALEKAGTSREDISVFRVAGAFELPLVLRTIAATERYNAAVALGAVIRGETPHFDYVAGEASRGIAQVMLQTGLPIGFGLLTTDTVEQAMARAGGAHGNKGFDAACAALETASLLETIGDYP